MSHQFCFNCFSHFFSSWNILVFKANPRQNVTGPGGCPCVPLMDLSSNFNFEITHSEAVVKENTHHQFSQWQRLAQLPQYQNRDLDSGAGHRAHSDLTVSSVPSVSVLSSSVTVSRHSCATTVLCHALSPYPPHTPSPSVTPGNYYLLLFTPHNFI